MELSWGQQELQDLVVSLSVGRIAGPGEGGGGGEEQGKGAGGGNKEVQHHMIVKACERVSNEMGCEYSQPISSSPYPTSSVMTASVFFTSEMLMGAMYLSTYE